MRLHPLAGISGLAAILFLSPLNNYLYEITHHYRCPTEALVAYLNRHGSPEDVVAITYGDLPLKFYTNFRVVGGLTGEDLSPALKARWVILRHEAVSSTDLATLGYLEKNLRLGEDYQRIELDCTDVTWDNRESPDRHCYKTATGGPPVIIFRRINPPVGDAKQGRERVPPQ
jgi:hypothetical protein